MTVERTAEEDERRMPFLEHLSELRTALRNSVIAIILALIFTYWYQDFFFVLLVRPLVDAWNGIGNSVSLGEAGLVFGSMHEAFTVKLKLALLAAVVLASPIIFYQLWRFVSPGLYPRERRFGLVFVMIAVVLFLGGSVFAYLYVLPAGYKYFLGFASNSMGSINTLLGMQFDLHLASTFTIKPMLTMAEYLDLTSTLLFAFGLAFELPLILSILALMGIVSAKQLWSWNRYAILAFAIAGAVLTPGDMVTGQLAMTGALTVLYNISILFAFIVQRKKAEDVDSETALALRESVVDGKDAASDG